MATNKKLYRSKEDKVIFGVCGGLGEYFSIDPVIVRIIFVVLAVWGGSGILAYIILAIVIPEVPFKKGEKASSKDKKTERAIEENVDKLAKDVEEATRRHPERGEMVFGLILLFLGISLLANNFFPFFNIFKLWPVVLIILALAILFGGEKEKK